jgi:hypothetical protein
MAWWGLVQGDAVRLPLPDCSVDLVVGSPPYRKARLYLEDGKDLGIARDTEDWIEWMLAVTTEALRVCRGAVVWVAAGSTEDRNYHPICEGLMYRWWRQGGHAYRPCYWHRVGIPGSGGDQWFRADVEYAMCFKRPGELPWSDNTACGHPPVYGPGGAMANRRSDGSRVNDPWHKQGRGNGLGGRQPDGRKNLGSTAAKREKVRRDSLSNGKSCSVPVLANPGNLLSTGAGGGNQLGHELAYENEAPFVEEVPERFILSLCPPGGTVLDPFDGSGTSVSVAVRNGRNGIGLDLRRSQADLARRRIVDQLERQERPHKPRGRSVADPAGQNSLFDTERV